MAIMQVTPLEKINDRSAQVVEVRMYPDRTLTVGIHGEGVPEGSSLESSHIRNRYLSTHGSPSSL